MSSKSKFEASGDCSQACYDTFRPRGSRGVEILDAICDDMTSYYRSIAIGDTAQAEKTTGRASADRVVAKLHHGTCACAGLILAMGEASSVVRVGLSLFESCREEAVLVAGDMDNLEFSIWCIAQVRNGIHKIRMEDLLRDGAANMENN